jgi:gp16 family phage-associated protein
MPPPRTVAEARRWFELTGEPVSAWARAHGFQPAVVYALLSGRTRGRRGHAHRAAVALGIKRGIERGEGLSSSERDAANLDDQERAP